MEADLPQSPDILFNYTEDDLRNPTVVKNSYTKTITLGSTNANDRIFGSFFDTQFKVNAGGFNPTKKLPFQLFLNGDLVHEGYARLDSIQDTKGLYKYTLTLFGGLGDFFYELTYDNDEGGKKSLADLHYISGSTSADEFDFTINMGAVRDAWKAMTLTDTQATGSMKKWKYINFIPAYEGIPDDFDSDKALINFRDSALVSGITSGTGDATSAYTAFDGYALAELSREHTGNEMREFRSYLQRPCLNVRKTIEAICQPENNGGYEVDLDSHFFNEDNPYWTDTWMTLPLLKSFETVPDEITGTTLSLSGATYGGINRPNRFYWQENALVTGGTALSSDNMYAVQASFTLQWNKVKQAFANLTSTYPLDFCMYVDDYCYQASCMIMQLVAYNSNGEIVSGGKAVNLTSSFGHGGIDYPTPENMGFVLPWGKEYTNDIGTWDGGYNRTYSNTISLSIENVPAGATVKLVMRKYNLIGPDAVNTTLNICLCGQRVDTTQYTNETQFYAWDLDPIIVTMTDYSLEAMNSDVVRSGSHFKKANILSTSYSPADFLLSYGKMFGLYFSKDRYEKKIYIRDRNTYYIDETENIHDLIDRSQMTVKPVFVGTKWLDFKTEAEESEDVEKYKELYGIEYGLQRANTGYDFNADIADLFKDSIFKGGIPALEKSECYSYFDDDKYKPWMLEGYTYDLYLSGNTSETTAVTYSEQTTIGVLKGFRGSILKYYDLYEGLQFHDGDNSPVDGSNVLVFYNGNLKIEDAVEGFDYGLKYWITDDNSDMMVLNDGKPCWLWTVTSKNAWNQDIAVLVSDNNTKGIPLYSRYKYFTDTNIIRKSLDFGTPKQLFNPLTTIDSGVSSDIYTQFWKDFVRDLYSPDTRVVTTKVLLDEISEEDMRKWWWFDNSIWRLNKVTEYNIAAYKPTTLEFVKVQDTDNYKLTYDNSDTP